MLASELADRLIYLVEGKWLQERHQVDSFRGRECRSQIQVALLGVGDVTPDPFGQAVPEAAGSAQDRAPTGGAWPHW